MKKICQKHNIEKIFRERFVKDKVRREYVCVICESEYGKNYYDKHKNERIDYQNNYYKDNKNDILDYKNSFYNENKEQILSYKKDYYNENKSIVRETQNKYKRKRRKIDPAFRLREFVSRRIYGFLENIKDNESCLDYLDYTIKDLKIHLESLFESWMNWSNQGIYDKNAWDDSDPSTWTWQIDHIIPHSTFKYTSMKDQEFKDCWALSNLRPYSAKQNFLDGISRIRH